MFGKANNIDDVSMLRNGSFRKVINGLVFDDALPNQDMIDNKDNHAYYIDMMQRTHTYGTSKSNMYFKPRASYIYWRRHCVISRVAPGVSTSGLHLLATPPC